MNLKYAVRSSFVEPTTRALLAHGRCVTFDEYVTVELSEEGYQGSVLVEITELADEFLSDWEGKDPTRFPMRIRAAATALRDLGCYGRFRISHTAGHLEIRRAEWGS